MSTQSTQLARSRAGRRSWLQSVTGSEVPLPTDPALRERIEMVRRRAESANMSIPYLGIQPLFEDTRLYPAAHRDWAVMPLASDPTYRDPDGFPVPRGVLRTLEAVEAADLRFDNLFVAHELQKQQLPERRTVEAHELLPPASPRVANLSRSLGAAARQVWTAAAAPLAVAALVGLGIGALAVAPAAAIAGLAAVDPILLGVTVRPGRPVAAGEPAAWWFLAAWAYGEEEAPWRP